MRAISNRIKANLRAVNLYYKAAGAGGRLPLAQGRGSSAHFSSQVQTHTPVLKTQTSSLQSPRICKHVLYKLQLAETLEFQYWVIRVFKCPIIQQCF